jgi:hypothetical protein
MRLVPLAAAAAVAFAWSPAGAEEPATDQDQPSRADAARLEGEAAPGRVAAAAPSPSSPASMPSDEPPAGRVPSGERGDGRWGVLVDAGLPQGATLSAAYRPVSSVRLFAGPAWNYVGYGLQGGVAIAPWRFAVAPVLTVEGGRYFGADVSFLTKNGQGIPPELSTLMKSMTYTYGAVHAGVEFGSQNGFSFAVDLGLAYVALSASGTVTKTDASSTVTFRDPRVRGTLPSLKLGFHYWF